MNAARLYHMDSSVCVDHWSCGEQEHTSIPPRCGAQAADRAAGCELPKGHPGPHLHGADRKCRAAGDAGTAAGAKAAAGTSTAAGANAAAGTSTVAGAKNTAAGGQGQSAAPSAEL
jgi:hypothetical protein